MSDIDHDLISLMAQQHMSSSMPLDGIFIKYTHEEVHNTVFFLFLRGISTDAGRDILDKFIARKRYKKGFLPEKKNDS